MTVRQVTAACLFAVLTAIITPNIATAQVVVDNDAAAPAYVETGTWATGTATGYNGGTYRFASTGAAHTAQWTGNLSTAGSYEVFVWYLPGSNRATAAKYTIAAADGNHDVTISQVGGGLTWTSLGTFNFNAGNATITLDAGGSTPAGTVVIADAVRFGGEVEPPCSASAPDEISPGVTHVRYDCPGPQVNHVVEFDLADPTLMIEMGFSQAKRNYSAKEPVTAIANRYELNAQDVLASVNCAFFEADLGIIGLLGGGSNLVGVRPDSQQTYILQESGEGMGASNVPWDATVRFADSTELPIGVLNERCTNGALILYTPDWGSTTGSVAQRVEVIIENVNFPLRPHKRMVGRIAAVKTGAGSVNNAIPARGMVLASCTGADALLTAHAVVGDSIELSFDMPPLRMINSHTMATGNVWLIKDGAIYQGTAPERHPRTAIAWTGTHHWFVTFDGRQAGYAIGQSYAEMSDFLLNVLHVDNAINLDGGGSTTLVINGTVTNCPSDSATTPCNGVPRAVPNALMLVKRPATSTFPMAEDFPAAGRVLAWRDKFNFNPVVSFSPPAPGSDGLAMEVRNTSAAAFETTSLGNRADADYIVTASMYCEYRPELAADGYERYGIFARDDGNANFDGNTLDGGNCYALTYDTNDGRIRAGVITEGVFSDFLSASPLYATSSDWRDFRIECNGDNIRFKVNNEVIAEATDTARASGSCGIGYHSFFNTASNVHGAHAAWFSAKKVFTGDRDNDGDTDIADFNAFKFCLQGPVYQHPAGHLCHFADATDDRDVDLEDFAAFQQSFTGAP